MLWADIGSITECCGACCCGVANKSCAKGVFTGADAVRAGGDANSVVAVALGGAGNFTPDGGTENLLAAGAGGATNGLLVAAMDPVLVVANPKPTREGDGNANAAGGEDNEGYLSAILRTNCRHSLCAASLIL